MPTSAPPTLPLKYVVGIDIVKGMFVASFSRIDPAPALRQSRKPLTIHSLASWPCSPGGAKPQPPRSGSWPRLQAGFYPTRPSTLLFGALAGLAEQQALVQV